MLKQGPDFHFDKVVIRNKRVRENESRLYNIYAMLWFVFSVKNYTSKILFKLYEMKWWGIPTEHPPLVSLDASYHKKQEYIWFRSWDLNGL